MCGVEDHSPSMWKSQTLGRCREHQHGQDARQDTDDDVAVLAEPDQAAGGISSDRS